MIEANAPASPGGLGRRLATLLLVFALPLAFAGPAPAWQEDEPEDASVPQDEPAEPTPPAEPAEPGEPTPDEEDRQEVLADSVYVDPNATAAMRGSFDQLHTSVLVPPNTDRTIAQMARGAGRGVDAGLIDRYIKYAARQLTDRDNIRAVTEPGGQQSRIQAIEEAGRSLALPYLDVPAAERDRRFLQEYNPRLLAVAAELLGNHLYARVQVMQALSQMGDPQALDFLIAQLGAPDQPLIVKQLAAEGIKQIASDSAGSLSAADREKAAIALIGFLQSNPTAYWLAQARALQALGTLRSISGIQTRDQAVFANQLLSVLGSPDARLETRAWAAWAAGMLEVPPNFPQVNFSLAAFQVGRLAVEVGERIVELSDQRDSTAYNPERVKYQTALLVSPIFESLDGSPELRGSGMRASPGLGPHATYVGRVHQLVRQLAASSVELTRAAGVQRTAARDAVVASLNELRVYLDQNPPEGRTLVPGGPEFALGDAS